MRDPVYIDSLFFFASRARVGLFDDVVRRFSLSVSPVHGDFELTDAAGVAVFQTPDLDRFVQKLDTTPDAHFDFHLHDHAGEGYMFCHRPHGYRVIGLPYDLLDDDALQREAQQFDAVCGWGAGSVPPPDTIAQMRDCARARSSAFSRHLDGRIIPADDH